MLILPMNQEIREMVDVYALADYMNLPTYREVVRKAKNKQFSFDTVAKSIAAQCIKADGTIVLMTIGKRGGVKIIWTFGKV